MKILNADDKAENLYLIETLFRGNGHDVVSVRNGREGLAALEDTRFDAVVSDLLMPVMDGFQLISEIRSRPALEQLAIIVYTATYIDARDEALALNLGADRFVVKPAEPGELLRQVEEAVRDRRAGVRSASARAVPPSAAEQVVVLKEYNSRLIAKLEKKMVDLESANRALAEDIKRRVAAETERNRLETQLRHAQKMEAIGTMAGGIAHDFNNLLAGIMCAAELGKAEAGDPRAARQAFDEVLAASNRARDLVKQILTFSRQQPVERRALDLAGPVAETVRFLRPTLPAAIELRADLPAGLPAVLADPTQVHQVVANLCTNARHATANRSGASIRVWLEDLRLTQAQAMRQPGLRPCRYVRLSVSDNGCGMDEATRQRVFDPFFTTKPAGVGTGLGLSVVDGIMRASDGAIHLETEPGKGTTFHLYFPAVETADPAPAAAPRAVGHGSGQRIFFVDDEPLLASLGDRLLRHLGYEVSCFTSPLKALDAFKEKGADVVLVDLCMPGMDGIELGRRAMALRPGIPIVLMTGFTATLTVESIRSQGRKGLLLKPFDIESMERTIREVLSAG